MIIQAELKCKQTGCEADPHMTISAGGYTKRRMPVTPYPGKKPARKSLLI